MENSRPAAVEDEGDRSGSSDPFMLHVLLVFVVTWLANALRLNNVFFLFLCSGYLYLVERRSREKERHRIGFEVRRELDKSKADEAETLRWLNEGLKNMWPVCMENFASKYFFGPMVPWFLNTYKPKSVSRVMLQSLTLGSTPPMFSFIRALEVPEDGDHVAFEAVMEFVSGNDMNAEISVQLIRGICPTFYVSKLAIKGTAKISVKFVKGWPAVGRVRLCFANPPDVTLTARPMYKKGMDMNSVPGAANWLVKTVDIALKHSVVKPNMLVVDIEKLVTKMMWPDPRPQKSKTNSNGVSDFFYVENKSAFPPTVLVEILDATNLKAADRNGKSDPFVEVILGQHNWKTKIQYKTLNPTWTEHHRIPIVNWELPNLLTLRVQDYDTFKRNDELGMCSVDVKSYRDGARHEMQLPLEGECVSTGQIRFAITVEMNSSGPQVFEEPQNIGVGSQEIQISPGSTSNHTPPSTVASILRSPESDSKSKTSKKHSRHTSTEDSGPISTVLEQTHISEFFEIVEMPSWPSGSLTIQHPGSVERVGFPVSRKLGGTGKKGKSSSGRWKKTDTENVKDHEDKRSVLSFLRRKKRLRRGASSHESLGNTDRESTVSDQSGYTSQGSLDGSIDLNSNVKMTLLSPENSHSPESHDMYVRPLAGVRPVGHLEPILSQETPARSLDNSSRPDYETLVAGDTITPDVQGLLDESMLPTAQCEEVDDVLAESQQPLDAVSGKHQQPEIKQQKYKSLAWWKKLTRRAMRRKRRESKGLDDFPQFVDDVVATREGEYPLHQYNSCTSDQSSLTTPVTQSFRKDPIDLISTLAATSNSRPGESPELRKIITGSRASGSQSCRVDPVTAKKLINVAGGKDPRVSQSFRHDSLRINDNPHVPNRDSGLRTIPEKKLIGLVKPQGS